MRRRGSSTDGPKLPLRSFGISSPTSPAWAASSRGRCPLRSVVRVPARS